MAINISRLKSDIEHLSTIGRTENGITRSAFSAPEMEARAWLKSRMEEAGLQVRVDGAGNIRGRLVCENDNTVVACGSHIDTVNCGGHLDGALGVLAGLEALRSLKESGVALSHPVEVIAFSDEEGRFGGMLGSRAFAGMLTQDDIQSAVDVNGMALAQCMSDQGFDPSEALSAKEKAKNLKAFVELHIEQGPVLEKSQIPIGVVDAITGLFKWEVTLRGQANHAGTTPMDMRRDAFQGLAVFSVQIDDILKKHGSSSSKTTIGKVGVFPGSPNVVPGACVFTLEVRDTDQALLDSLDGVYRDALERMAQERDLELSVRELSRIKATPCDPEIVAAISAVAEKKGIPAMVMPSGAAHDAQNMAKLTKTGMIFVPSINGISHSPKEDTAMEDIQKGAEVLCAVLQELAE
ncbi:MAG: Zn-dependent hydrolase [Alphaproteobacteria bacterium]|nr:Zn-dependent hydrolase [Alphaproteobacteria bacterium]